jgi:hypothetical protein
MNTTTTQTTEKTGIEAIDCADCGAPHIVDYDLATVEPANEADSRITYLDDDSQSFDCRDCGSKVQA